MTLNNMIFSRSFGCFPNLGVSQTWGHPCTICPGQKTTTTCITTLGTPWVGEFPWVPMMLPIQGIPTQLTHSWWNPLFCWLKSPILLYLPYETRQLDTLHLCVLAVPDSHFYHPKSPMFGDYVFCWRWFHTKSPNVIHMSCLETSFQLGFPMKIPTIFTHWPGCRAATSSAQSSPPPRPWGYEFLDMAMGQNPATQWNPKIVRKMDLHPTKIDHRFQPIPI